MVGMYLDWPAWLQITFWIWEGFGLLGFLTYLLFRETLTGEYEAIFHWKLPDWLKIPVVVLVFSLTGLLGWVGYCLFGVLVPVLFAANDDINRMQEDNRERRRHAPW